MICVLLLFLIYFFTKTFLVSGCGSSNDGNTARRFFHDPEKTAAITGLDPVLIKRFATILRVISCGEPINVEAFANFTHDTAQKYVDLYGWYYMPSSVHKLLIHGAEIVKHFGLMPIGKLSEEAAEARNKDFKRIREHHSRKFSRVATNEDIFNGFLISSDPYISSIRPVLRQPSKNRLTEDMKCLLLIDDMREDKENIEFVDVNTSMIDSDSDDLDDDDIFA